MVSGAKLKTVPYTNQFVPTTEKVIESPQGPVDNYGLHLSFEQTALGRLFGQRALSINALVNLCQLAYIIEISHNCSTTP
jgi:hypothetical protein